MADVVGTGLMVTCVVQKEVLLHASFTVHVMVDAPVLKKPLALFPDPERVVTPVTSNVMTRVPVQSSDATSKGIVYILLATWQIGSKVGQAVIVGGVGSSTVIN